MNRLPKGLSLPPIKKVLLIMKLMLVFTLFFTFNLYANGYGQQKVNIRAKKIAVAEVLSSIEKQTNYRFLYNNDLKDLKNTVTISAKNAIVTDILPTLFTGTVLTYQMMENNLIVVKEDPAIIKDVIVTGQVLDENGAPLAGVSVMVKGTTVGTTTDADGNFTISVPNANSILVFSSVGFTEQEYPLNGATTVTLAMMPSQQVMDQVVVIGYGTATKKDLTGSIATVKSEEITKQPAMSAMQSVQGKVAGLNIVASDQPGAAPNVIIRGLGTALGGRNPLYVVDGMPVTDITNINPNDIESMDVLKDASSASIYGLRAANGVIIVTTKKGRSGFSRINFDSYAGVKNILNKVKMANANQYTTYVNENLEALNSTWSLAANQQNNTDWYDELIKPGYIINNAISFSGGSDRVDYFLSANNFIDKGILEGSKFTRNTIRNNNTYKFFNNRLRFNQTLNLTFTEATPKPNGAFNDAYRQSPLVPVMYANGRYGRPFVNRTTGMVTYERNAGETIGNLNSIGNPVYAVLSHNELTKSTMLQGGLEGEFKILDYLKLTSRIGGTKYYFKKREFSDIKDAWLNSDPTRTEENFDALKAANPGIATYANNRLGFSQEETFRWVWETFLNFQKRFDQHNIDATIGFSREKTGIGNKMNGTGYDVPVREQYWNIDLASLNYQKALGHTYLTPRALASYFGRVQYNFASKYYLTATLRRDGSSVFRETGEYWGTFPSVGIGWTISNESFMKEQTSIDFLKIRANWGKLGNQDIPLNVSQILTDAGSSNRNYVLGPGQDLVFGAVYGTPAVGVSWEITREAGIGVDFGVLSNKLTGSVDYYNKLNTNTILNVTPLLNSAYEQNYYAHGGKVLNSGVEVVLNYANSVNDDFSYNVGLNYAYNKNRVKDVLPAYDGAIGGSLANGQITKQLREGQPIYAWWMYEANGVWQNAGEIAGNPKTGNPLPGHLRYADQNGDGLIDDRDKIFLGSYIPTSTYGINLGVNYKKLDASVHAFGVGGNKIYNALKGTRIDGGENITEETFTNRWTGEGSTNTHPGAARDSYASSYYLESGSFFRINNITVGYRFDRLFSEDSNLRLYFTAQNPLMFTKYSGFSPEVIGSENGAPNETSGIELTAYPTTRNFIFGLNFQF